MNKKENIKYIKIILIIVIALLVIFALRKNKNDILQDIDNINLEENTEIINEENENGEIDTPVKPVESSNIQINTDTNNKKLFDESLSSGSAALINKEYNTALTHFNKALTYKDSDLVYARIFSLHSQTKEWNKAIDAINKAINLNPSYTDYWNSKLLVLDEQSNTYFAELKTIYQEGLTKVDPKTKINLITNFARIAENNGEKNEAIALWETAIETYPQSKDIYQKEIDRLKNI